MIIATAGHVDHGKTHSLQALTGTNADRLPEEQKRGLTIDLGYAFMPYLSAITQQQETLGFIDVPGYEKFLSNMLAGVGTAHHAMLIVAGDEGMMAQSYEHLAILRLLAMDSLTVGDHHVRSHHSRATTAARSTAHSTLISARLYRAADLSLLNYNRRWH
ncbi:GTP-binding protein [Photobacterium leiognathi]|uniref:GTP-binding protein n=1 Tax=Photobacterium leiognathi TaxID=553611 RepID=UPI0027399ACE|nr:GTP-binding protein [Photobacterium leiognathi]